MTDASQPDTPKRRAGRSPSYPGIDLTTAINRVTVLHGNERQHATPIATVYRYWGYTRGSGGGNVALAALKKFGLVDDEGSGNERLIRVTDLAVNIIANPDTAARAESIKRAALIPTIHREMWDKYRADLPSDETLHWELVRQRSFTESGAREFLANYRNTLAQAGLDKDATIDPDCEDTEVDDGQEKVDPSDQRRKAAEGRKQSSRQRGEGVVAITVPLPAFAADQPAVIEFPGKLSESEWKYFIAVLTAMKDGVVKPDEMIVSGHVAGE